MDIFNRTRNIIFAIVIILIVTLVVFNATSPDEIGAGGILFVFGLLYLLSYLVTLLMFKITLKVQMNELSSSGKFMLIATVAGVPVIALALHTLGQLFLRDTIILVGLTSITIFYWLKRG